VTYAETQSALREHRARIEGLRKEMRTLQAAVEPQVVKDYLFETVFGEVRLAQLFGDKADLFVVHNMGTRCSSCTMWADGFNGVYQHLAARAAFVLVSDDPLDVQRRFAGDRGWRFPMARAKDASFHADMGYWSEKDRIWPGISAFHREGDQIVRVSDAELGPADDFCTVYHFLDMLPDSYGPSWSPKFQYYKAS
jgi:predicted dithiol-disulfide oxidoreductase (DUF899 family)